MPFWEELHILQHNHEAILTIAAFAVQCFVPYLLLQRAIAVAFMVFATQKRRFLVPGLAIVALTIPVARWISILLLIGT